MRKHWATFIWPLTRTVLLIGVTLPFANYIFAQMWLTVVVLVWWLVVVIWGLISWFTWYLNITLVTSQRVIDIEQRGLLRRRVRETQYQQITEVTFDIKGLLATIFGYGDVSLYFTGGDKPIIIDAVGEPEIVKDQILKIKEYLESGKSEDKGIKLDDLSELFRNIKAEQPVSVRVVDQKKDNSDD